MRQMRRVESGSQGQRLASTMYVDGMKEEVLGGGYITGSNHPQTGHLRELDRVGRGTCVSELRKKVGTRSMEGLMRQSK